MHFIFMFIWLYTSHSSSRWDIIKHTMSRMYSLMFSCSSDWIYTKCQLSLVFWVALLPTNCCFLWCAHTSCWLNNSRSTHTSWWSARVHTQSKLYSYSWRTKTQYFPRTQRKRDACSTALTSCRWRNAARISHSLDIIRKLDFSLQVPPVCYSRLMSLSASPLPEVCVKF
jgi:hypothetical protein